MPSSHKESTGAALRLADLALSFDRHTIDADTREAALRCMLDILSAAAAGMCEPGVRATRRAAAALHGPGEVPVWFTGTRLSAAGALFVNSTAASALDLDDGHRPARGHPGAAVIPAAWAVLRHRDVATLHADDLLAAIAAGYEVGVRAATALPAYKPSGAWSPYAVIGCIGNLRKSPPATLAHAIAIAAQQAPALPGLAGLQASDVKEGIPWGSLTGFASFELACEGFTGPLGLLDEPSMYNPHALAGTAGARPLIDGTYFKRYAACRHAHGPLDALISLTSGGPLPAEDIEAIDVHTYHATFNLANLPAPATLIEAQYSVPYCLSVCALRGPEALLPMRHADLVDRQVQTLARHVTLHHDPGIEAAFPARSPGRVVLTMRDGTRLDSGVVDPRGDPWLPLSWSELQAKFRTATRRTLRHEHQHLVLDAVDRLREGELKPLLAIVGRPALCEPSA